MPNTEWCDINDPGFWQKTTTIKSSGSSSKGSSPTDSSDTFSQTQNTRENPLVKLSEGKFLPPSQGLDFNEKCTVRIKVEFLDKSASAMKKVTFRLFSIYKDKINDLCHAVDGYEEGGYAEAEMIMFYPPDHKGNDESAEYFFKAGHVRAEKEFESEKITIPYQKKKIVIPWIIDCHMHINSGHCSPLPLSKARVPIPGIHQKGLDIMGTVALGKFGSIQKKPTDEIGTLAIKASKEVLDDPDLIYFGEPEKRKRVMISLPMNMDYAHYRGYEGRPICEYVNGRLKYWNENEKIYLELSDKDIRLREDYCAQLKRTSTAFYSGQGSLLSFYHYDPRANLDDWRLPFNKNLIQTADSASFPINMPAIGIKMYTALGYKPMDQKLKFPWNEYYGYCQENQIPIICHGSGGGMPTHDQLIYYDRAYPENKNVPNPVKVSWFNDNFISPSAWEPVLKEHSKLYLCLAHFGGEQFWNHSANPVCKAYWKNLDSKDPKNWIAGLLHLMKTYPNFYVDLAYFMFEPSFAGFFKKALAFDPIVKERILFGTDWWLVTMEGKFKGHNYRRYVENMCEQVLAINDKKYLNSINVNDPKELLAYFMVLNPIRFLQLKKVAPILSKYFYLDDRVIANKSKFELDEWINSVPEKIEDFYR